MKFPDKVYDILKWICLIAIPALTVLLSTVLPAVGVDAEIAKTVVIVISAVGTFLGALIGVSTVAYKVDKLEGEE